MFQLFDKDEDGILSFPELSVAIRTLGQRHSGRLGEMKIHEFIICDSNSLCGQSVISTIGSTVFT